VEHDHIGALDALAFALIWRRPDFGNYAGFSWKRDARHSGDFRASSIADKAISARRAVQLTEKQHPLLAGNACLLPRNMRQERRVMSRRLRMLNVDRALVLGNLK
jgi:hypothetical protein